MHLAASLLLYLLFTIHVYNNQEEVVWAIPNALLDFEGIINGLRLSLL